MLGIPSPLEGLLSPLFAAQVASDLSFASRTVIFGIAGQSNAVGRGGPVDPVLDATDPDILMYNAAGDSLVTASDPLDHFDETTDTVGYGLSFAKAFKAAFNPARVILVGLAEGGTGFIAGEWSPARRASSPYSNARNRWDAAYARAVASYGAIVVGGILWSQGEDEVANWGTLFDAPADVTKFRVMPTSLFETMRAEWAGLDAATPVLVTSIPSGSAYTGNLAYDEVQAALSGIPTVANRTAFVDGTDLTEVDTQHWDAASQRTMGSRLAAAYPSALANEIEYALSSSFTKDPANVETPILLDARPEANGAPVRNFGTMKEFDNKRVDISSGTFLFDGSAEFRWIGDATQKPRLAARDFKLTFEVVSTSTITEQGIISDWQNVNGQRSFVVRYNSGNLEFYGSSDGINATLLMSCPWDRSLSTFEIKRVGTAWSLTKDSVEVDTYTGAFTFYDTGNTLALHIGDHMNNRELFGSMSHVVWEFLS